MLRRGLKLLCFHADSVWSTQRIQNKLINGYSRCMCVEAKKKVKPEDVFGTFSSSDRNIDEAEDETETDLHDDYGGVLDTIKKMKTLLDNHEYEKAKNELRVIQKRRKAPTYIYKLLMSYNAKLGNVKEVFSLYNDYKKRGYFVRGAMYTSLFTAAAKCPRTDVAVPIIDKVSRYMLESKAHKPNKSNYNALLMAYGRHGDIGAVMKIITMLEQRNVQLKIQSYSYLLDACLSDKSSGLRFALIIWHHMLKRGIAPDAYSFTTMMRCVRDCSLGDVDSVHSFIDQLIHENGGGIQETLEKHITSTLADVTLGSQPEGMNQLEDTTSNGTMFSDSEPGKKECQAVDVGEASQAEEKVGGEIELKVEREEEVVGSEMGEAGEQGKKVAVTNSNEMEKALQLELPNLLSPKPKRGSVVRFDDLSTPENRFMLFGGLNGFLEVISHFKVKPDIKLLSVVLECLPQEKEAEEELIRLIEKYKVKVDTAFLNTVIKRKILRREESSPEEYLDLLKSRKLAPDVITFGTIAVSCKTYETGKRCMELAKDHGIRLNTPILGALLSNARKARDVKYVKDILRATREDSVEVNGRFLVLLKTAIEELKTSLSEASKREQNIEK